MTRRIEVLLTEKGAERLERFLSSEYSQQLYEIQAFANLDADSVPEDVDDGWEINEDGTSNRKDGVIVEETPEDFQDKFEQDLKRRD